MFPKGPTSKELKAERRRELARVERAEDVKVRDRSDWRCEAFEHGLRCWYTAVHIHHKLKGRGVRGRGKSALAEQKLHLCLKHHNREHGL